jgi:hypothetical protein
VKFQLESSSRGSFPALLLYPLVEVILLGLVRRRVCDTADRALDAAHAFAMDLGALSQEGLFEA